jgi:hypothetical protein
MHFQIRPQTQRIRVSRKSLGMRGRVYEGGYAQEVGVEKVARKMDATEEGMDKYGGKSLVHYSM